MPATHLFGARLDFLGFSRAFEGDIPLRATIFLKGIILCSTITSNPSFHHLLCWHDHGHMLKNSGFALQRCWTQMGTQNEHEFGKTWQMQLSVPQR